MEKQSRTEISFTRCCAQILHQASHSAGYFNKRLDIQQSGRKLVVTLYNDFQDEDKQREKNLRLPRRGTQARARRKERRALERSSGFSEDNTSSSCASPPPDPPPDPPPVQPPDPPSLPPPQPQPTPALSTCPVSEVTQPDVRRIIENHAPFSPDYMIAKPKNLAKDKQDGSECKHQLFAQPTPQAEQHMPRPVHSMENFQDKQSANPAQDKKQNINKVQPSHVVFSSSEQNPRINDLCSLMNTRMGQRFLKEASAQPGGIDLGRRPPTREIFCHFCQRIRLHIHKCSGLRKNVYTDNHNKIIVCHDDIRKLDCMAPADLADAHGPIPPPAQPAALLTGDMVGNTPSAFQEGQKILAENLHAAMNQQYKESIKPVKSAETSPALQDALTTALVTLEPDLASIMNICDSIRRGDTNPKYAVVAIKKKFYHTNPQVALYALQVMESCVKNCGILVHKEISTKQFLEELKDLVKQSTNEKIKTKVLELLQTWGMAFE